VRMGTVCVYMPPTPNHWDVMLGDAILVRRRT
jgi:hypothetical protein